MLRRIFFIQFAVAVSVAFAVPVIALADRHADTETAMEKKSGELKIENKTLAEAISIVARGAGVEIEVDWKELDAVEVKKEMPAFDRFRNASFNKVLSVLLEHAADKANEGNPPKLTHYVDEDGRVVVTTGDVGKGRGL